MNKLTAEILQQLKSAAQEEIMCREASDTSDAWQDLASPENVLALIEIALPVLEQQSGWISCSERMPEIGQGVLYYFEVVGVHAGTYAEFNTFSSSRGSLCGDVTHWMPLPAPPKPKPSTPPQIDNDGWVEWGGGKSPVPGSAIVAFRCRDGYEHQLEASEISWRHDGMGDDIIAYRVIENDGREG